VRKFAQDIGDGAATSITVTHSLNTLDVQVQVYDKTGTDTVECDVTRGSVNQVTIAFAVAPTAAQYRVVVQG
jgi:phage head maturation protease